ncbi:hypothetical protein L1276_003208 [Flavobacterium sp. HSC-32F16]|uniref:hypothetical protein n=1 Tax=Flavobacterium sp. HSC-32F16 TaxID=2910964 RepID=UPI0020A38A7D|nr:hypothetical protein [Flavobacterium sp. HSC-32F16]MCP2028040.1 hypothetical protein [Flavobacterium sp. HSC-32F16]
MKEILQFGFVNIEDEKVYSVKLSDKQKEQFGFNNNEKSVWDYFEAYLEDNKLKDFLSNEFTKKINETFPKELKASCIYCNGNSKKEEDKKCYNYHVEGRLNEFLAVWWFVNIIEQNKRILYEKATLRSLSIKFYECFLFKNGRVAFDLRKITMYCLNQGFLTLSKIFSKNDKIKNLEIINRAIDELDTEYLRIKMFENDEPYHIKPQKDFFKNKRRFYKEQIKIENLSKSNYKNEEISNFDEVKDCKTEIWFLVGCMFASGKMEKYYFINDKDTTVFKDGFNASKAAKDLGNNSYNKFILATINNYPANNRNGNKNIFNSREKMQKIISHCESLNVEVVPYFKKRLPDEKI